MEQEDELFLHDRVRIENGGNGFVSGAFIVDGIVYYEIQPSGMLYPRGHLVRPRTARMAVSQPVAKAAEPYCSEAATDIKINAGDCDGELDVISYGPIRHSISFMCRDLEGQYKKKNVLICFLYCKIPIIAFKMVYPLFFRPTRCQ